MTYFVQTALSNNSAITKIIGTGLRFNKPVYLCQGWPTFWFHAPIFSRLI